VAQGFESIQIGESFAGSTTVTETHVVTAAGLFGDFAPLHVDEEYAKTTLFGTRIAHGTLITGMMAGVLSGFFGPNATGYLEQTVNFRAPVFFGDTVTSTWTILDMIPKERFSGGIVELAVRCTKHDDTVVLEGNAKLIVRTTPAT
jgi:3-hydroxybutyryl-CoA dehydratase